MYEGYKTIQENINGRAKKNSLERSHQSTVVSSSEYIQTKPYPVIKSRFKPCPGWQLHLGYNELIIPLCALVIWLKRHSLTGHTLSAAEEEVEQTFYCCWTVSTPFGPHSPGRRSVGDLWPRALTGLQEVAKQSNILLKWLHWLSDLLTDNNPIRPLGPSGRGFRTETRMKPARL